MKNLMAVALLLPTLAAVGGLSARASDHDDGEVDGKGRNLNLTDLYVFREDSFEGGGGAAGNLVMVMNSNPRSLPQQQYYFSTQAVYDFHVSRAGTNNDSTGTTNDNVILRFQFGAPNASKIQTITMTTIVDGVATGATGTAMTTPLGATPTNNTLSIGANTFTVFAGLRADPFYFDVQSFFKWRANVAASTNPALSTLWTNGVNFAFGYNVNSIVVRLPISYLQKSGDTIFDTWITVSTPK